MSADRDITEVIVAAYTSLLRQEHVRHPETVARKQIAIAKSHGIRFAVPVHWHDPNADPSRPREPGDPQAGVMAALAALGKGVCSVCGGRIELADGEDGQVIAPHEISDDPPHPPFHPCPGGRKPPRTTPSIDEQEHRD